MKEPTSLRWLSCCRFRSSCGTRCSTAFVTLSHSPRAFHHKTSLVPPPKRLENFRVATTRTTPGTANLSTSVYRPKLQKIREPSIAISRFRHYSQSSTPPVMAEVEWTGLKVRQTFFDFFAERGHTIGWSHHFPCVITPLSGSHRWAIAMRAALFFPFAQPWRAHSMVIAIG